MILEPKSTTVAYRCPSCGSGIMSAVGVFNLSADRVRLKCSNPDCASTKKDKENERSYRDNAALDITLAADGTVRLSVPCIFCGKPHVYNVNTSLFYGREVFMLPCPYSGINICFMGDANHVKAELARNELELLDLLEEPREYPSLRGKLALHGGTGRNPEAPWKLENLRRMREQESNQA